MLNFNKSQLNFQNDLLQVGPITKFNNCYKIPVKYDNKSIQVRFPKAQLKGIFYNQKFNSYSLLYPETDNNDEQIQFHQFMKDLNSEATSQLVELIRESELKFELNFSDVKEIYHKSDKGNGIFIKFPSEGEDISPRINCFDLKGKKQDINEACKYGMVGDYIVVANIPGFFMTVDKKKKSTKDVKAKAYFQVFGNTVFTNATPQEIINPRDCLGDDFES